MSGAAYLMLENGMVFEGKYFGGENEIDREVTGELVFSTGMTGYLETLTDPSYCGQIVLQTFPLIGNYGVISSDFESPIIGPKAYIVKYPCQDPSNFRSEGDLDTFFKQRGIVGLCGIDTRAVTRVIRENGVMNGKITAHEPSAADLEEIKSYRITGAVEKVSRKEPEFFKSEAGKYTVALLDFGMRRCVREALLQRGADVWEFPHAATLKDITGAIGANPDGIVLSNGPGDPLDSQAMINNVKEIISSEIAVFGVGLGHQLLSLANGFETEKLKYGHRGASQPVRDTKTGRLYITNQNHGYAVVSRSIAAETAEETFVNVNDGTCEGIRCKKHPVFSVQFLPDTTNGANGTGFIYDEFINGMEGRKCR